MLPDQTGGAYLGLASGQLLHISGMPSSLASSLYSPAGAALEALIALPQAGFLAAHADGSINEFSRTQSGLVAINHYRCADKQLAAIAVDPQQRWLACVGDDVLRLFYLSRSRPLWQAKLNIADDSPSAAMLAVDKGVVLLAQPNDTGAVSVNSWQFAAEPVVDMQTLWMPQHHQGEAQPGWEWEPQASSQSIARLSLLPLLFGTFKAALLGMIIALPLAFLGAIYTALLLSERWRERIKPMVEMLESLPTVILGFIGALWLAPLLQQHLMSLWLLLLLMPVTLALTGYYWTCSLKQRVAPQLRPMFPYLLFAAQLLLVIALGMLLQWLLFAGSFSAWLETAAGWTYDLHNALLVGLVLGLGIVPSIFALVEDALTAVPRRLQMASLALGASRWQTVWQVMLPAASAGILAAVLIGFGRALGETMIVLMVSSNTPIMESSLLRGLQAIAPTLASEMSEASPDSVHFRVLLFAALVLFGFTFVMNSLAELFRARLRRRYQS
jgi:phosphate transport system permease protein